MSKVKIAVLGSGNIGTDLMYKLQRSDVLEMTTKIGVDPASEGLARASKLGYITIDSGIQGFLEQPDMSLCGYRLRRDIRRGSYPAMRRPCVTPAKSRWTLRLLQLER